MRLCVWFCVGLDAWACLVGCGQQIGAVAAGYLQALCLPPLGDFGMVAAQQYGWNVLLAPEFGAGVVGAVKQAAKCGVEAVLYVAVLVVQHARLQAGNGIKQCNGGYFAARQHKVAQADLGINASVDKTLVYAFVAPTYQNSASAAGRICPVLHLRVVKALADG